MLCWWWGVLGDTAMPRKTRNLRHALLVARFVRATVLPSGSVAVQAAVFVFDISLQEFTGGSESKSSELSLVAARV